MHACARSGSDIRRNELGLAAAQTENPGRVGFDHQLHSSARVEFDPGGESVDKFERFELHNQRVGKSDQRRYLTDSGNLPLNPVNFH